MTASLGICVHGSAAGGVTYRWEADEGRGRHTPTSTDGPVPGWEHGRS
jgi:hypothetical protein